MDDQRFGATIRRIRQRRGWRQQDLADRAGVSQSVVSRIERGLIGSPSVDTIRAVAAALEIRVDLLTLWRGGDLDRLLNAGHSALHEAVARRFHNELPAWTLAPEVSFSIYGERGIIDILAWHPGRRALLVIELKTDITDVNELIGTFDRKRRLARQIGSSRGWDAVATSSWLIVTDSRTNRRRVDAHAAMLRGSLPQDATAIRRWLRDPVGTANGLSFWTGSRGRTGSQRSSPIRRVRTGSEPDPERGSRASTRLVLPIS
jgi:transcriptional regulator with XRE-family HTH domain